MKTTRKCIALLLALLMVSSLFAMNAAAFQPIYPSAGDETEITEIYVTGNVTPKAGAAVTTDGIKVSSGLNVEELYWTKKSFLGTFEKTKDSKFAVGAAIVESAAKGDKIGIVYDF